ncbi:acyltransferase ChoActase/COT/CPT [Gautieria morchelliformis]|nr:acyltransferase ChoActase/COT/CPT [Gautieria morchelliformis]
MLNKKLFAFPRTTAKLRAMSTGPKAWKDLAPAPPLGTMSFAQGSLKALAWDDAEYRTSESKVNDLARGFGPELQRRLEQRRDEPGRDHWLEEWWDEGAYLAYRDSVMINVSYYYGFDAHPAHYPQTAAHRASALTRAALLFRRQLKRGLIEPDATKEGPMCMDSWRWMFDCCRVPSPHSDWSVTYAKEGDMGDSGHIVVFRNGQPWRIDAAPHGHLLSTEELQRQFKYIYNNTTGTHPGVGTLTSSDRDTWAKNYVLLAEDSHNATILREIHSAAFVVSLDTEQPDNVVDFSRALWHGGVQGICLATDAGLVGEHSVMDGTPTARMCDEIVEDLHSVSYDHGCPSSSTVPPPQSFHWNITPTLSQAIMDATEAGKTLLSTQTLNYHLTRYGKAAIKAYGVSPDSWAQMIVQLAYHRLAATTRRFLKGRTEAIRVASVESESWLCAMHDPTVDDATRKRLFTEATKVHIRDAKEAGKAQGVDRHLFGGLRKLVDEGEPTPALFSDPLYLRSSHWTLSTSAIWSKHFPVYGWGEVVPDGFGVAYMTGYDDRLQFTVTSRKEMPNTRFVKEIAQAANDLRDLFESDSKRSKL